MTREKTNNHKADFLVSSLSLDPHPEGGYFRETYRSNEKISSLPERFEGVRNYSTSIYYLLDGNSISAFHRIKSDELWHFYEGCGLFIHEITKKGTYFCHKLGNNLKDSFHYQITIGHGSWFAAENITKDSFSFVGCTVSPGFDFKDFEMAKRNDLITLYPHHREIITHLTY